MKKHLLALFAVFFFAVTFSACNQTTKKSETAAANVTQTEFTVYGTCQGCQKTIETAAQSVKGVTAATWDVPSKKLTVSYDAEKVDVMDIHRAILEKGYETDKLTFE